MRPGGPRRTYLTRAALGVGLVALLAACGTSDFPQDALSPAGPVARSQDRLWQMVFPVAIAVFVLVQGLILFAVWKFRARGDETELPKQVAGNTRLEIAWTIVPALILVWVAVPTVQTIFELSVEPPEDGRIDISVVGKQYWWEFEYPAAGVLTANEMVIPTGTPVYVLLDGIAEYEDAAGNPVRDLDLVMHSFWVPRLAGKLDFVPGHERRLVVEADEPGVYMGQCAEYCGLSHANMRFLVRAVSPAEFDEWVEQQAQDAVEPQGETVVRGHDVFGMNCVPCHQIQGHPDNGGSRVGPDLTHFASRDRFAGAIFDNDDAEMLRRWIRDPQREKPGSQMLAFPPEQIPDDDLDALVDYLLSLD